ncbi:Concanavalin A-like lectin/glucanases superfamily protein [Parasphingorhabdus marina DSM 22363]|uniref:Concanavalin A-like lectin/glucanases superfamily protein n=1 Tax=Parasphingorhabdus marina DSM 22363 TaxID=1123272 RepID=A0A1N6DBS4_9SPHN|nr:LamG-like jellyroll fold domain-containing protein [Parasphingorhabdus marina]SIN68252.1 Concanavalin A-like lectin/glucanases superfamily protein [Parasphingorhabdus marina DSM 22363]
MKKSISAAIIAFGLATSPTMVAAQDYTPDVIELTETGPFAFEPAAQLDLSGGGAVEFWIATGWMQDPGYDPPVLINIGGEGISYLISVMRERDGLVFANADDEDVFLVDLSDGNLHHVAINVMDDGIEVYVDGVVIGTSDLRPLSLPSSGLYVGGLGLEDAGKFTGAIGQLRFWKEPLREQDIVAFRMRDVLDPDAGDHPDAEHLSAMSDFSTGQMMLVESVGDAQ